ncbi:MAG: hypothetical protein WAT46_08800, partial [Saprospiraceae bacterium]
MKIQILFFFALAILISSCKNNHGPDVSSIKADVHVIRTENDLFDAKSILELKKIIENSAPFYDIYMNEILGYKGIPRDSQMILLESFIKDSSIVELQKKTKVPFGDFSKVQSATEQMLRHLKYYFPEKVTRIPNVYTYISEFGHQMFIFEDNNGIDGVGIGLDMFLHPAIHYKMIDPENTNFSDYITRSWDSDHVAKKLCDIYVADIVGEAPGHRMIDQMIHNGKQLYISKLLMPEVNDTVITEYSLNQLNWCKENELQVWTFFMENKLFYETNLSKINKYLNPSPNSPEMPAEAPGRTANYIGWKIV